MYSRKHRTTTSSKSHDTTAKKQKEIAAVNPGKNGIEDGTATSLIIRY
ncbi:hypothetical protein Cylst_4808 [Cylindrospermum stagnale PCC 7417]|uniref:Uncharacterized protein n=1 Tax=Cylindrospermum stagnale PCC 7417 TaxID=56107 RepID=K9X2J3_9NOST|nr:hypothetical protein [Cylindrospermum stagnale]AFZ26865.1 hypothetical protein Cylst_4808 [Cylindrospermum stagnale PCC 7417]